MLNASESPLAVVAARRAVVMVLKEKADVVISNGVINLSPRKVRALAEAFRVLRPGGRMAFVDLVLEHDLPLIKVKAYEENYVKLPVITVKEEAGIIG